MDKFDVVAAIILKDGKFFNKLDKVLTPNGALKVERGPKEDERVG